MPDDADLIETIPCTGCGLHAALYVERPGRFLCGRCGAKASIFVMPASSARVKAVQERADAAVRALGHRLDGLEPALWEGDQA